MSQKLKKCDKKSQTSVKNTETCETKSQKAIN